MALSMLTAFWVVSISLVMVPGADWAYVISAGMRRRAIAPAIGGMLLSYLMMTVAIAAGIGTLVASVPAILAVLTFVGAGYLIWLGINVLTRPSVPAVGDDQASCAMDWFVRGLAVSGMNPKAFLLYLALLPQFTSHGGEWSIFTQIVVLGLVQIVNCAVIYSLVGLGSKAVLRTRPKVARMVSQFSGAAMIAIALLLLIEQCLAFMR